MGRWSDMLDRNLEWVRDVGVRIDSTGNHTVSMTQLASEIEQHLRLAGIAVVSPAVPGPNGTRHTLRVVIAVTPSVADADQSSLGTQVRLHMWGKPLGFDGRVVERRAWMTEVRSQFVSNADIDTLLREDVEALVDEFVAAYRSVHQQS